MAKVIGEISSAAYGGFVKILSLLSINSSGPDEIISIQRGQLSAISGAGFIFCDLTELFGENNLDIINPQRNVKMLKLIKGGDKVVIVDDEENSRYLIANYEEGQPQFTIRLPKPDDTFAPKITKPENLGDLKEKAEKISIDMVRTLSEAAKNTESNYFILEIIENGDEAKIASVSTEGETFEYKLETPPDGAATSKFKLFNPFPISKLDEFEFELYKDQNSNYWVKTISTVGMVDVEYVEKLNKISAFDSFSLI